MIPQILQRTPPWVFALFAVLLVLGVLQSRPRAMGRTRVAMMPAIFLPLSLWGIWNAFGPEPLAFGAWLAAVGTAVLLNRHLRIPRQVSFAPDTRLFRVAGSWVPLALMMAIFFTRYAIAVATAMQPALKTMPSFAAAVGFAYGLMSGSFLARAVRILGTRS
jgi:uncharacterized protein DUF6622